MKKVNMVHNFEILEVAQSIGYDWNNAVDILRRDSIFPEYEVISHELNRPEIKQWKEWKEVGWSEDTIKILKAFFKKVKVNSVIIVRD